MKEIKHGKRCLQLHPLEKTLTVVYIDTLEDIYKAINARCFDIAYRQIGTKDDKIYDIYCDDVGLFKHNNHLAAYGNEDCLIVGDILIAKHDANGEMINLSQSDIDYIGKQIYRCVDRLNREIHVLFPISYPNYNS